MARSSGFVPSRLVLRGEGLQPAVAGQQAERQPALEHRRVRGALGASICSSANALPRTCTTAGGAAAVRALAAPFVGVQFMPTGGIGPANLADYLALPAVRAVGGSWMVPRAGIDDARAVALLVQQAVHLAASLRP